MKYVYKNRIRFVKCRVDCQYELLAISISGHIKYWKCKICGYKTDWNPQEKNAN